MKPSEHSGRIELSAVILVPLLTIFAGLLVVLFTLTRATDPDITPEDLCVGLPIVPFEQVLATINRRSTADGGGINIGKSLENWFVIDTGLFMTEAAQLEDAQTPFLDPTDSLMSEFSRDLETPDSANRVTESTSNDEAEWQELLKIADEFLEGQTLREYPRLECIWLARGILEGCIPTDADMELYLQSEVIPALPNETHLLFLCVVLARMSGIPYAKDSEDAVLERIKADPLLSGLYMSRPSTYHSQVPDEVIRLLGQ